MSGFIEEKCKHGKPWLEECHECDQVMFDQVSIPELKRNCQWASDFIKSHPYNDMSQKHIADLYMAMAHLFALLQNPSTPPAVESGEDK